MSPTPARLKLLSTINAEIDDCVAAGMTGELNIKISFNQGGLRGVEAEISKKLSPSKKKVDNVGLFCLTEK